MKIPPSLLRQIELDLGLNRPFIKGQAIVIKNCWHFSTDGMNIDVMFVGESDFKHGMNSVYIVAKGLNVIVLAFVLMDTHVHFILYGSFDDCCSFMSAYIKRISRHYSLVHGETHKFDKLPISHQHVETDEYLKTVICYTVKNPSVGGIPYMGWYYPWSSAPLYFVPESTWTAPSWISCIENAPQKLSRRQQKSMFNTKKTDSVELRIIDGIIFPGEYVAVDIVHRIFKTCKSYNYFMCRTREDDVDSRGGLRHSSASPWRERCAENSTVPRSR